MSIEKIAHATVSPYWRSKIAGESVTVVQPMVGILVGTANPCLQNPFPAAI